MLFSSHKTINSVLKEFQVAASNGQVWQFGKLKENFFTKHKRLYRIDDLDRLIGAIDYIFKQCEQWVDATNSDRDSF